MYVFDTNSLSKLKHYHPGVFRTMWDGLEHLVQNGVLISTREVWNEMQRGQPHPHVNNWLNARRDQVFTTPTAQELQLVARILAIPHFHALIGAQQRLRGTPVADPFVIACAGARERTVVTEEIRKPNAAKIPNVCDHFGIPYMNFDDFMLQQGWIF